MLSSLGFTHSHFYLSTFSHFPCYTILLYGWLWAYLSINTTHRVEHMSLVWATAGRYHEGKMRIIEVIFWLSLGLSVYIQIGYPFLLLILIFIKIKIKNKSFYLLYKNANEYLPKVSIIIAAYNEEKTITKKLENTLKIEYPKEKLEIIVFSDASTDRTDEIVNQYAPQGVRLIRVEGRKGKTYCQDVAVQQASVKIRISPVAC